MKHLRTSALAMACCGLLFNAPSVLASKDDDKDDKKEKKAATAAAKPVSPRGIMLANTCVGCHGQGGSSLGPATPTISGMAVDTFTDAMKNYRDGKRPSTVMGRLAKGYTDEDIAEMANYFVTQKFVRVAQKTDPEKVKLGRKLHKENCDKCHEDNGFKDEDGSSILAGQWLPYLQFQMVDFNAKKREMPEKMAKRVDAMIKEHGDKSLDAVSHFYASQQDKKAK
jgi:cytochrome subunit of sulfide dehydrogenase